MLRSVAKDAAAQLAVWANVQPHAPYIAGYHRVVERTDAHPAAALPAMEISVTMFTAHLEWLAKHFEIVSVDALDKPARSKPRAAITFDDGYREVFYNAFPILERKGVPAAFFVITDLIGTEEVPLHDRLYASLVASKTSNPFPAAQEILRTRKHDEVQRMVGAPDMPESLRPMTWEMLQELSAAGMTIGSHSMSHAFLTNESLERVDDEVRGSRTALLQHGIAADCFAYPGGDFNTGVVDAVHAAGYRFGFTVCRHRDPRYPHLTLRRRGLWERSCLDRRGRFSPSVMRGHAASIFGRAADCPKVH